MMSKDKKLNPYTPILEDAQSEIKLIIFNNYLKGMNRKQIVPKVNSLIERAVKQIKIPSLKADAIKSLNAFANKIYNMLVMALGFNGLLLAALIALNDTSTPLAKRIQAEKYVALNAHTEAKGIPMQEYYKSIYTKKIVPTIDRLASERAIDPGDVSGRNSLRNLAEMQVRYTAHLDEIARLKAKGTKLVVSSVHADCSDRCFKWQGKVYSLDGSSGITEDGRSYEPLEKATDVYYTTKAGRVYKNGLLGFNCRHKLYEYVPKMVIPTVTKAQQTMEYVINTRQRMLEANVRACREEALVYKDKNRDKYLVARKKAIEWNAQYIEFSHANGRAYYPDRTKILK